MPGELRRVTLFGDIVTWDAAISVKQINSINVKKRDG